MTMMMFSSEAPSTVASTMASGRNGMTRNQSVSRSRMRADPAAVVARRDADQRADHHRDDGGGDADEQRDPRAPDDAAPAPSGRSRRCRAGSPATAAAGSVPVALVTSRSVAGEEQRSQRAPATTKTTRMIEAGHARCAACGSSPSDADQRRAPARPTRWTATDRGAGVLVAVMCAPAGRRRRRRRRRSTLETTTATEKSRKIACSSGDVRPADRLVGQQTQAGPGEDRLDGDRARDDEADVEEDQRDGRQQRVGHGVPPADHPVHQPLGPRGRQVVLAELVDQRGAHDQASTPRGRPASASSPAGTGARLTSSTPGERAGSTPGVMRRRRSGRCPGNGPMPVREQDQQDHAEPELRHRVERQRDPGRLPGRTQPPRLQPPLMPIADADDRRQDGAVAEQQRRSARRGRR